MADFDLHTWATPDGGWKASATLEELGLSCEVKPVDITTGIQKSREFIAINPNGRIPALVEPTGSPPGTNKRRKKTT